MKKKYLKSIKMLALIGCSAVALNANVPEKSKKPLGISTDGIVVKMLEKAKSAPKCCFCKEVFSRVLTVAPEARKFGGKNDEAISKIVNGRIEVFKKRS